MRRSVLVGTTLRRLVLLAVVWALVTSSVGFAAGSPRTALSTRAHPGGHPRLVGITLSPDAASLVPGERLRFAATGRYSDGSSKDVTWWVRWKSSDASVVALSRWSRGRVTAIADGTATITATAHRVTGSATVTVGGSGATLGSIEITPEGATTAEGGTVQYAALGRYSDATSRDITSTVAWSSSDPVTATIDAAGLATGLRFGATTITAAQDGVGDSVALTVSPRIESIEITPHDPSILSGGGVRFGAIAHFTDGSSSDLTSGIAWSSSDPSVATIDAGGAAIGLVAGSTTIRATCGDADLCGSLGDSTTLTVSEPSPPTQGESSQGMIDDDLEAGIIDYPTSLMYRTWALFRDLRLPFRYLGAPSLGEDQALFRELDANFDTLPAEVQDATQPYLVPPNDPRSAFGPASDSEDLAQRQGISAPAATDPTSTTRCQAPRSWRSMDWTPVGGGPADGFRVMACARSDADATNILTPVLTAVSSLWGPMTEPEPDGMGKPIPDNVNNVVFGNGKIDIFIVYTSDCIDQTSCPLAANGGFVLGAERTLDATCQAQGHPSNGCSGYLVLNAGEVCPASAQCPAAAAAHLKGVLAHELFHLLQDAHNAKAFLEERLRIGSTIYSEKSWYYEASATWAGWYFGQDPDAYVYFTNSFQDNDRSLLYFGDDHEYASWVWPLLMHMELGASSVFESWQKAESATDLVGIDDAVNDTFSFADRFRDLSVRNLNPAEYFDGDSVGLEGDLWQTDVADFPETPHELRGVSRIELGEQFVWDVDVVALAAEAYRFDIAPNVRQVTIDIGTLKNASNADLDIVGRLASHETGRSTWDRIRVSGTKVTFCRDSADQNFDLVYVVLSNHGRARSSLLGGADPDATLGTGYEIKAKDHCDVPIAYEGTFHSTHVTGTDYLGTWTREGTVRFEAIEGLRCDDELSPEIIMYCYEAVSAEITLTISSYASPATGPGCVVRPHGPLHFKLPDDDPDIHGGIAIVDGSKDPKDNLYQVFLSSSWGQPGGRLRVPATVTCDWGTFEEELGAGFKWMFAPDAYGRTGWHLSGSYHAAYSDEWYGDTSIDEVWEFTPIFEDA